MKNSVAFGMALPLILAMLLAGLFTAACDSISGENKNSPRFNKDECVNGEEQFSWDGSYSLTITADKTVARVGDTVTITAVFKNLSGKDIEAELPGHIFDRTNRKPSFEDYTAEDILHLRATIDVNYDTIWNYGDMYYHRPYPEIVIEKGAVIEQQFKYTITALEDRYIGVGAFFITPEEKANIILPAGSSYNVYDIHENMDGVKLIHGPVIIRVAQ